MLDLATALPHLDDTTRSVMDAAPATLLDVSSTVDFRQALEMGDPRYVDTTQARAEGFQREFQLRLGYDPRDGHFTPPAPGKHVLFFGHVGCGKSTELTRLCTGLHDPTRFWVVRVNLLDLIDSNNARYSDVWLAVSQRLLEQAQQDGLTISKVVVDAWRNWFHERVRTLETMGALDSELKTEASTEIGIPFIAKLLGKLTTAIKVGASYRDSLRMVVQNTYSDFVTALNQLVAEVGDQIRRRGKGQEVLFAIDGADRFQGDDWRHLFIDDANQLTQIRCVAVYTAPMALLSSGARLDLFGQTVLPMVKLWESDHPSQRRDIAFTTMRELVLKRCHYRLFDSVETLDKLIEWSGGHLRDLLRLLSEACIVAEQSFFDIASVDAAAGRLASNYRAWLSKDDYAVLARAEQDPVNDGAGDAIIRLVERGALLEYNHLSWRRPHPVVRTLAGFNRAMAGHGGV